MCKSKLGFGVAAGLVGAATVLAYKYENDRKFRAKANEKMAKAKEFVLDKVDEFKKR